ncbi:MAG: glutathione S-transferase [Acetobacteraceae bacterium]|nr:glutathione S-transferase [Acetobacteraceae bacterium]
MPDGRLTIGTRRYSSWSLRGWLAVRLAGLDVDEVVLPLAGGNTPAVLALPSRQVPYLEHRGNEVWESVAIAEYCAEHKPGLWPDEASARSFARVVSAEMHAGFRDLRMAMPMNLGREGCPTVLTPDVEADIARVEHLWARARDRFGAGGPYLFGAAFTLADAMYAPVVTRFQSYAAPIGPAARAYCDAVRAHPLVAAWYDAAVREPEAWRLDKYEQIA